MNPFLAMVEARSLYEKGYRITSRAYRIVSRVDISDQEMIEFFIKDNFGDATSGVPSSDLENQKDFYRRVISKDKIEGVDPLIIKYLGDIVSYGK